MLIKSLIWDADGTLFDTYPPIYRSVELALASFGISVERQVVIRLAQVDMATCFDVLAQEYTLDVDDLIERYRTFRSQNPSDRQPLYTGLREFCEAFIACGGRHYIVTHRDRASLLRLLDYNQCAHWFEDIIAGDDVYPRKPDPSGVLALMQRNDIAPRTTMFVGDRELDIQAARNAGILACQFGSALTKIAPDLRITQYVQLMEKLQTYNGFDSDLIVLKENS